MEIVFVIVIVIMLMTWRKYLPGYKYRMIRKQNRKEGNTDYLREIEVDYSPAVLSYLYNQKIEAQKDITACILNLCVKGVFTLVKSETEKNKYDLIDNINYETESLTPDEKILYLWIVEGKKYNIDNYRYYEMWKDKVMREYKRHDFSKVKEKIRLRDSLELRGLITFILCAVLVVWSVWSEKEIFVGLSFIITLSLVIWGVVRAVMVDAETRIPYEYTKKGIEEMCKWLRIEDYIKDYTLLKGKTIEDIVISQNYLVYALVLDINKNYKNKIFGNIKLNHFWDAVYIDTNRR